MARRAVITHTEALAAKQKLIEISQMDAAAQRGMATAAKAASDLWRYFQIQERYALEQQTPADFARAARNPATRAAELDRLTEEQHLALQAQMTADYPGKPS